MLDHGHFVLFFDCELHLAHLERLLELVALRLQVLPSLLLLPSCLVALVEVAPQVLYLFLLLPEDLSQLVCRVLHVLKHIGELVHRLGGLIEHVPPRIVVQVQLVYLLLMAVDFTLGLLDLLLHVLSFKLRRAPLLVHDINGLLLTSQLPIDILQLAAQTLCNLGLGGDSLLQLLVLHHLLRGGTSQVRHLGVQLALQIVQANILMLLLLIALIKLNSASFKSLMLYH